MNVGLLAEYPDDPALIKEYFTDHDVDHQDVITLVPYIDRTKKKTAVRDIKEYIETDLVELVNDDSIDVLLVSNADYFKVLAGITNTEAHLGIPTDCKFMEGVKLFYVPNHRSIIYNPDSVRAKIKIAMDGYKNYKDSEGVYVKKDILKHVKYPPNLAGIRSELNKLSKLTVPITIDIETFSLKFYDAGIASISFSWDEHSALSFLVDYKPTVFDSESVTHGEIIHNQPVRELLREYFDNSTQKHIYHNVSFDATVLVYQLYMKELHDFEGMFEGFSKILRDWECTQLMTYFCTNSCAGNELSLKIQAQEFAGSWAVSSEDIKDVRKLPAGELLEYNAMDTVSTYYVYNKYKDKIIEENQQDIYQNIFKPSVFDVIQAQLNGMPLNMVRVKEVAAIIEDMVNTSMSAMMNSSIVQDYTDYLRGRWVLEKNQELKTKVVSLDDAGSVVFNPNSNLQLQELLFTVLDLPVLERTPTKAPATGRRIIKALVNHTEDETIKEFLNALIDYLTVFKIYSSFIPQLLNAKQGPDGWHYLFGNFRLGGTVSSRLSSNGPNLQQLPSSGKLGALIKSCFQAPKGWMFIGLDFNALESRIDALLTKDPNKLVIYTKGFDSHAFNAYHYWPTYFNNKGYVYDVTKPAKESAKVFDDIKQYESDVRDDSKPVTFALQYRGTFMTLVKNSGFEVSEAKSIVDNYHTLYKVSEEYTDNIIKQASDTGYVTAAFGLKVRTPIIKRSTYGRGKISNLAASEARTAGNAISQSWGLLNNRAVSEFMGKVRNSEHAHAIQPASYIHDASYYMIKEDLDVLHYTNTHLVEAVKWQDHPAIAHDEVGLTGDLSVFFPSWNDEIELPHHATKQELYDILTNIGTKDD